MNKKLIAALTAAVMTTGCGSSSYEDLSQLPDDMQDYALEHMDEVIQGDFPRLFMYIKDSQSPLMIQRPAKKNKPMGKKDTWTVFLYLCGTDLERRFSSASDDLLELCVADESKNVRFVVQTGGTEEWLFDEIDPSKIQRWVIEGGNIKLVDTEPAANMGDPDTLADFLNWGVENYPAARMGVTLWDHGSGCINGACFDELNKDDSLSLAEMEDAFADVYENMTDQFEFVGFDCCLMSTAEVANIMTTYSRYFYASQEVEPGSGWYYTEIADFLAEKPSANGAELGKLVADSYYDHCAETNRERSCTFTILDLKYFDNFVITFNDYAKNLYNAASKNLSGIVRGIGSADNFGGNNWVEGYTNMVDLGGIANNCSSYADGKALLSAMNKTVCYKRNGRQHKKASGLSVYYPLKVGSSEDLKIYSGITLSPYYLSIVDMVAAGHTAGGYDNSVFFTDNGGWHSSLHGATDFEYADESSGISSLITFEEEPRVEDNFYSFTLDSHGLKYTAGVEAYIARKIDSDHLLELGEICDIYADWESGEFADSFDGYWFSLPDGQLLPIYIVSRDEECQVFTSPILLNGKRTNLRITCVDVHNHIEGTWSGIDENGMAGRDLEPLKVGDVICPVYKVTCLGKDKDEEKKGKKYTWSVGDDVTYNYLDKGEYLYGFGIEDVYGDYYITDYASFTIDKDGEITFAEN